MPPNQLIQLTKTSILDDFDCGEEELNDFLKNDALQNQNDWISSTYLLYQEDTLLGFFTITVDTIQKGHISESDQLRGYPYAKYPAIKLARLGVNKQYHRQGIGTELLLYFFKITRQIIQKSGARYITVDAKKSALPFYESFGFQKVESRKMSEFPPMYLDFYSISHIKNKPIK